MPDKGRGFSRDHEADYDPVELIDFYPGAAGLIPKRSGGKATSVLAKTQSHPERSGWLLHKLLRKGTIQHKNETIVLNQLELAMMHLKTEVNRFFPSIRCRPAVFIFRIVSRLILTPVRWAIKGAILLKYPAAILFSGSICYRNNAIPFGFNTRLISLKPATGSGTEQNTNVAITVSKVLS